MLVLSRKSGENIVIPQHEIAIRVIEIQGNRVRLGITAPADCAVYREEVWERMQTLSVGEEAPHLKSTEENGASTAPRQLQP